MRKTLAEARKILAPHVGEAGKCANAESVLEAINQAREMVWPLGEWPGTLEHLLVIVNDKSAVLPARIESAKKGYSTSFNRSHVNGWYSKLAGEPGSNSLKGECTDSLSDLGDDFVTAITPDYFFLPAIYSESNEDEGVQITLEYETFDSNFEHETVTLGRAHRPVKLKRSARKMVSVSKPQTKGRVVLLAYPQTSVSPVTIAIYEAKDINPRFRRFHVNTNRRGEVLYIVGKKHCYPITREEQILEFDMNAMIEALNAVSARRAKDPNAMATHLQASAAMLQKSLSNRASFQPGKLKFGSGFNRSQNII